MAGSFGGPVAQFCQKRACGLTDRIAVLIESLSKICNLIGLEKLGGSIQKSLTISRSHASVNCN